MRKKRWLIDRCWCMGRHKPTRYTNPSAALATIPPAGSAMDAEPRAPSARLEPSLLLERDRLSIINKVGVCQKQSNRKNRLFTAESERGDKSSRFPNLCRKPTRPQRMSFL